MQALAGGQGGGPGRSGGGAAGWASCGISHGDGALRLDFLEFMVQGLGFGNEFFGDERPEYTLCG